MIDPAGGNAYAHPATINSSRNLDFTKSTTQNKVTDIDQSLPATTVRVVDTTDFQFGGGGTLHTNDLKTYSDTFATGNAVSYKIQVMTPGAVFGANTVQNSVTYTG